MLSFDEAQARLAQAAAPLSRQETVALHHAVGRVLAADLIAAGDMPPADNSAMDGYAIRYTDLDAGAGLPVSQCCYAGDVPAPLAPGSAARIFTGARLPAGADTVVMQEHAAVQDGLLRIELAPRRGQNVRLRGEDIRSGAPLLAAGTLLAAAHIGLLASQGMRAVPVFGRLQIGILTTGDELAQAGAALGEGQIHDSNGPMLAALVAGMGAEAVLVLHAGDRDDQVGAAFHALLDRCDLVISVGGVSVGERDRVGPALQALGAELDVWKVKMKPGKPMALAYVAGAPVICLPGNPVAAFAVFALLVTPLIRRMQGREHVLPQVSALPLRTETPRSGARDEFLRVSCRPSAAAPDGAELLPYARQGSADICALSWSSGFARLPADVTVRDGDPVRYYDFRHWLV